MPGGTAFMALCGGHRCLKTRQNTGRQGRSLCETALLALSRHPEQTVTDNALLRRYLQGWEVPNENRQQKH